MYLKIKFEGKVKRKKNYQKGRIKRAVNEINVTKSFGSCSYNKSLNVISKKFDMKRL